MMRALLVETVYVIGVPLVVLAVTGTNRVFPAGTVTGGRGSMAGAAARGSANSRSETEVEMGSKPLTACLKDRPARRPWPSFACSETGRKIEDEDEGRGDWTMQAFGRALNRFISFGRQRGVNYEIANQPQFFFAGDGVGFFEFAPLDLQPRRFENLDLLAHRRNGDERIDGAVGEQQWLLARYRRKFLHQ